MVTVHKEGDYVPEGCIAVKAFFNQLDAVRVDFLRDNGESLSYMVIRGVSDGPIQNLWYQLAPAGLALVLDEETHNQLEESLKIFDAEKKVH